MFSPFAIDENGCTAPLAPPSESFEGVTLVDGEGKGICEFCKGFSVLIDSECVCLRSLVFFFFFLLWSEPAAFEPSTFTFFFFLDFLDRDFLGEVFWP